MYKDWITGVFLDIKNNTTPHCPECNSSNIDYKYVGNKNTKIGSLVIWCNNCLKGVNLSRIIMPENGDFIDINDNNMLDDIPDFEMIHG